MIIARRREREYFANSPEYSHLSSKMGSEYLAKLLSRVKSCDLLKYLYPTVMNLDNVIMIMKYLSASGICDQGTHTKYHFFDK